MKVLEATASEATSEEPATPAVTTTPDGTLMAPLLGRLDAYTHGE